MNAADLISHVRNLNHDDATDLAAQQWDDSRYMLAMSEGMRLIYDNHPESRISAAGALLSYADADPNNPTAELTFPSDFYRGPLIDYVLYRYYAAEGGDPRDNSRASVYLAAFNNFFQPTG